MWKDEAVQKNKILTPNFYLPILSKPEKFYNFMFLPQNLYVSI